MKRNRKWTIKKLIGNYRLIKTVKKGRRVRVGTSPIKGLNWFTTKDIIKYYK